MENVNFFLKVPGIYTFGYLEIFQTPGILKKTQFWATVFLIKKVLRYLQTFEKFQNYLNVLGFRKLR
jgi:hypothetical protein